MKNSALILKSILGITLACLVTLAPAQAGFGGETGGGGDLCEDRIKIIRDALKNWISNGGPNKLNLPTGIDAQQYSTNMTGEINRAKVSCVGPGDNDYPVAVSGTAKVCRFNRSWFGGASRITCDYNKFMAMSESDQYVLIHHEYAGLSDFETPNQDDSVYEISNQISGYLVDQVVKKLAVNSAQSEKSKACDIFPDYGILGGISGVYVVTADDGHKPLSQELKTPELALEELLALVKVGYCKNIDLARTCEISPTYGPVGGVIGFSINRDTYPIIEMSTVEDALQELQQLRSLGLCKKD